MKLKRNMNLSLPWTPQGEEASGNHQNLLPREDLLICQVNTISLCGFIHCINVLTPSTVLLWPDTSPQL